MYGPRVDDDPHEQLHTTLPLDERAALLVDSLTSAEADRLLHRLRVADCDRDREVDAAIDAALSVVPRVARGHVRRALRGGR